MVFPDGVFSLGVWVLFMFYSPGFDGLPGVASSLIVPRSPLGVKHLKTSDNKEHHEQTQLKTSKTKSDLIAGAGLLIVLVENKQD